MAAAVAEAASPGAHPTVRRW